MKKLIRPGFTLVELILATAIFSFFLILVMSGIGNVTQIYAKTSGIVSNQQAARLIMDDIGKEMQYSQKVYTIANVSTVDAPASGTATAGLCIVRSSGGEVLYYLKQDGQGPGTAHSVDSNEVGTGPTANLYVTKRLYKRDKCDFSTAGVSEAQIGSQSSEFDNINVQNFVVTKYTNINGPNDDITVGGTVTQSFEISITARTQGIPASGKQGKVYDDEVTITNVIFPNQLNYVQ